MNEDTTRWHLHRAIQASTTTDPELDGAVLMGWLVIAEWMHPTDARWLLKVTGDATGSKAVPDWQWQGYAHNALHDWPHEEPES